MKTDDLLSASQFRSKLTQYNLTTAGYDSGGNVNALKAISQHKPLIQTYNLSLSGGNDNGKFRASFLASANPGIIKTTGLDKYLGTFGGTYKIFDKRVTLDFNLIAGHVQINQTLITNTAGAGGNLMEWALNWNPTVPFYNADGSLKSLALNTPNPLAALKAFSDQANVNTILANISATVRIVKGLDYKILYAINDGTGTRYTNFDGWMPGVQGISTLGLGAIGSAALTSQTFTHTLNYTSDITSNFRLNAVAGYEYWTTNYRDLTYLNTGFDINKTLATVTGIKNTDQMVDATNKAITPSNPSDPTVAIQSYFGRAILSWADKYILTGTFRGDGSSKFGANNHYGYFPSVGARWVISNEDFLKSSQIINTLALRGSWGITGSQDFPAGASQAQFAFTQNGAIAQTNVPNPNLKWQKTNATDIGLEYGFLQGRIYGSFDYYHKNTSQIVDQTNAIQPAPSGTEFINLNANLINKGFEFVLGGTIVSNRDFTWDAAFNISYNKGKLTNFNYAPILTGQISGNGLSGTTAEVITNNQPLDVFSMPHFLGYTKGGLDSVTATPQFVGDPNPHALYGFSSTLKYKHLSLIMNFGGAAGYKVFNNTQLAITNIGLFSKGQNVTTHAFAPGETTANGTTVSDKYLESGNFLKLRNLTLHYDIGNIATYFKNVSVFVSGTNLFVVTKFTGFDPEVNIDKSNNGYASRSMEYLPYPTPRILTVGFNTSF
jgi:TonB-dependent starch-binding outer membrane protein SusC